MALTVEELQVKLGCDATEAQTILKQMDATVKAYTEKFQKYFQTKTGKVKPLDALSKDIDAAAKRIESKANKIRKAMDFSEPPYKPSGRKYVGGDKNGRGNADWRERVAAYNKEFAKAMPSGNPDRNIIGLGKGTLVELQAGLEKVSNISDVVRYKMQQAGEAVKTLGNAYVQAVKDNGAGSEKAEKAKEAFLKAVYAAAKYAELLDRIAEKEGGSDAPLQKKVILLDKIVARAREAGSSIKKAFQSSLLGRFIKRLGTVMMRMAAMKLIRGTIQAVKEGLQELAKTSASSAKAMNTISAAGGSIKMALGAAVMPIVKSLAPVFITLASAINTACDAIARFFAVISGQSTYTAVTFNNNMDSMASAAGGGGSKLKGMLASFDQINLITSQGGGGGGGGGVSSSMSTVGEDAPAVSKWADLIKNGQFFELGQELQRGLGNLNTAFSDWLSKFEKEDWGGKIAEVVNGFFSPNENGEYTAFKDLGSNLGKALGNIGANIVGFILDVNWGDVAGAFAAFVKGFWAGLKDAWDKYMEQREAEGKTTPGSGPGAGWVGSDTDDPTAQLGGELLTPEEFSSWWQDYKNKIRKKLGIPEGKSILWSIFTGDTNLWDGFIESLTNLDEKINNWFANFDIKKTVDVGIGLVKSGWKTVYDWVKKYIGPVIAKGIGLAKEGWSTVSSWVKDNIGPVVSKGITLVRDGWTTVSNWVKTYPGSVVSKGIELVRDGWTTVSEWIKTNIGGVVSKGISLVKDGWTTVSEWVKSSYLGTVVTKGIQLVRDGWTNVANWISNTWFGGIVSKGISIARDGWKTVSSWITDTWLGGIVSKGVSLVRVGWKTVSSWITESYIGGIVSKGVSLTVSLFTGAFDAFASAWNGLKSKVLELKVSIADNIRAKWNAAALKWNSSFLGRTLGGLPYLAQGGIAYGPTMAVLGEYAGANNNPEIIAPLSKLQSILERSSSTGSGNTMTRDQANTMINLLQRIEKKENIIQPSVGLGQVVQRSLDAYGRV